MPHPGGRLKHNTNCRNTKTSLVLVAIDLASQDGQKTTTTTNRSAAVEISGFSPEAPSRKIQLVLDAWD
eukprot:6135027-Pyramimonas_sp.AAC.1